MMKGDKKKIIIIAFAFLLVIGVGGCSHAAKPATDNKQEAVIKPFIGGVDGLLLSFIGLPSSLYSSEQFGLTVQLQNKGESDIESGAVRVILPQDYLTSYQIDSVEKNNQNTLRSALKQPDGSVEYPGFELVEFGTATRNIRFDRTETLYAYACYPYTTTSLVEACLGSTLLYDQSGGKKVCDTFGTKKEFTSGSPIDVTKVTEALELTEDQSKYTFWFEVKVVGTGSIKDETCSTRVSSITIPISIEGDWITGDKSCKDLVITNNQGRFWCTAYTETQQLQSEQPVIVTIGPYYHYVQTSGTMTVRAVTPGSVTEGVTE